MELHIVRKIKRLITEDEIRYFIGSGCYYHVISAGLVGDYVVSKLEDKMFKFKNVDSNVTFNAYFDRCDYNGYYFLGIRKEPKLNDIWT